MECATPAPEILSALLCAFLVRDLLTVFSSSESNKSRTSLLEGPEEPLDALFRFALFAFDPAARSLSASSSESIEIMPPVVDRVPPEVEPELPALFAG